MPVSAMMDRSVQTPASIAKNNAGFLQFVCLPLYVARAFWCPPPPVCGGTHI